MGEQIFIQQNELFSYNGTNCVRNDYYHHGCQICVDICPEDAFSIVRNKLKLESATCNACAGCIGSCPTEALSIKSFDPNTFVQDNINQAAEKVSCKTNTSCLGVFDAHHFIIMALDSKSTFTCDLSHCTDCSVNKDGVIKNVILEHIDNANHFLATSGSEKNILLQHEEDEKSSKRALFRKAVSNVQEDFKEESQYSNFTLNHQKRIDTKLPPKNLLLNEAMKRHLDSFDTQVSSETTALFTKKEISFDACTLCKDCIQFCPTEALFLTSDKQGIFFTHSKCIGCGICDHICKSDAIHSSEGYDLVSIAINRSEPLVHYDLVRCNECKTPYPYKGGEPMCDRCQSFTADFDDMFTLAKDL